MFGKTFTAFPFQIGINWDCVSTFHAYKWMLNKSNLSHSHIIMLSILTAYVSVSAILLYMQCHIKTRLRKGLRENKNNMAIWKGFIQVYINFKIFKPKELPELVRKMVPPLKSGTIYHKNQHFFWFPRAFFPISLTLSPIWSFTH